MILCVSPDSFWEQNRHLELSKSEKGVYTTIDSLKHVKAFVRTLNLFRILIASFHDFGPVEIGPVITYYSYNPIEGSKLRFGGRTTPKFSKKINFEWLCGVRIKRSEIQIQLRYYFFFYTKNHIRFSCQESESQLSGRYKGAGVRELYFIQEGSAMLSLKRGVDDKLFYNKSFKVDYICMNLKTTFPILSATTLPDSLLEAPSISIQVIIYLL